MLFATACFACGDPDGLICVDCAPNMTERSIRRYARGNERAPLEIGYIGIYAASWRDAILEFKNGRRDIGDAFVQLLALRAGPLVNHAVRCAAENQTLAFVGIPTTKIRRQERGFDGGVFLADGLASSWGVPAIPCLRLVKKDRQRGKNRQDRLRAQGRFVCEVELPRGAEVMLVDDVLTTGATLCDAAACLEDRGIVVLGALALAYVDR